MKKNKKNIIKKISFINFIKNIFADDTKEEILSHWHRIPELPKWVDKAWSKKGKTYGPKKWYFKGHTFVYKIKVKSPQCMGDWHPKYYRRLRHKSFTLENEELEKRFAEIQSF